ncbi:MAG: esterase, partial [Solirubrobacterales bacterium]|nr:esterase [Solirubrobacterales bacterium]
MGPSGSQLRAPELEPLDGPCAAGTGFRCFGLRVDLDRSRGTAASRGRLTVPVAVETGGRPEKGYLLALTGGPGQAALPLAQRIRARLGSVDPGYRLVLLDQRGTG